MKKLISQILAPSSRENRIKGRALTVLWIALLAVRYGVLDKSDFKDILTIAVGGISVQIFRRMKHTGEGRKL